MSTIIEECALKCTDQIPPHLNFCTPSKTRVEKLEIKFKQSQAVNILQVSSFKP